MGSAHQRDICSDHIPFHNFHFPAHWKVAAIVLVAALDIAMFPRSRSTAVPSPGPACGPGVPAANQSSPDGPKCPGQLVVHNASCAAEPGRQWQRRAM